MSDYICENCMAVDPKDGAFNGCLACQSLVRSETGAIPSVEQDALRVYNGPLNLPALTVGPVEFTEKQMDALISHMNCDLPPLEKIHQDALRNYNGPLPMPAAPPLPTPRTDALENDTQNLRQGEWDSKALELARTLEREAAELRVAIAAWKREEDSWIEREAALTALQSREEVGRVSVPNDAASYPRDNALEVARSMEIAVIAWKAAHGNETLKHPDQSLLARSFLAVASELTWRDQLSAAPAPAAQDEYYWWCAGCQREVPQEEVGLDNKHTLCPNKLNRWRRAAPSPGAQSGSPDASGSR